MNLYSQVNALIGVKRGHAGGRQNQNSGALFKSVVQYLSTGGFRNVIKGLNSTPELGGCHNLYVTLNPGKMLNDTRPRGTCHAQTEFLKNDLADKEGLHWGLR